MHEEDHFRATMANQMLQGRTLIIHPKDGISLGGETVEELSDSTKWRVSIAIMAAIARTLRSPLLIIDAADILDVVNKADFLGFLSTAVLPYFEHVLVTATPSGDITKEQPVAGLTKWVLTRGELTKLG